MSDRENRTNVTKRRGEKKELFRIRTTRVPCVLTPIIFKNAEIIIRIINNRLLLLLSLQF